MIERELLSSKERLRQFVMEEELENKLSKAIVDPNTFKVTAQKIGRNDKCPCGSGLKFKKCCISKVGKGEFSI